MLIAQHDVPAVSVSTMGTEPPHKNRQPTDEFSAHYMAVVKTASHARQFSAADGTSDPNENSDDMASEPETPVDGTQENAVSEGTVTSDAFPDALKAGEKNGVVSREWELGESTPKITESKTSGAIETGGAFGGLINISYGRAANANDNGHAEVRPLPDVVNHPNPLSANNTSFDPTTGMAAPDQAGTATNVAAYAAALADNAGKSGVNARSAAPDMPEQVFQTLPKAANEPAAEKTGKALGKPVGMEQPLVQAATVQQSGANPQNTPLTDLPVQGRSILSDTVSQQVKEYETTTNPGIQEKALLASGPKPHPEWPLSPGKTLQLATQSNPVGPVAMSPPAPDLDHAKPLVELGNGIMPDEFIFADNTTQEEPVQVQFSSVRGSNAPSVHLKADINRFPAANVAEVLTRKIGHSAEISIQPEELGRVRMVLSPSDQGLSLILTLERPETLDMMRRHADQLVQELRKLGYEEVGFEFRQENDQRHEQPHSQPAFSESDNAPVPPEEETVRAGTKTGLDVRV